MHRVECSTRCILSYLDGGSDKLALEQDIISPIIASTIDVNGDNLSSVIFYGEEIKPVPIDDCPTKIAEGDVIAFFDGEDIGHLISIRKFDKRAIAEPPTSNVLKGPREGFPFCRGGIQSGQYLVS